MNNPAQQLLALLEKTAISEWSSTEAREEVLELARKCVKNEEYVKCCEIADEAAHNATEEFEALKRHHEAPCRPDGGRDGSGMLM